MANENEVKPVVEQKPAATKPAPTPAERKIEKARAEGLRAIHQIVYGKNQTAVPDSFFTPVSEDEREELLKAGAAAKLTKAEAELYAEIEAQSDLIG